MARTREAIFEKIPDLDPDDQRLINPDTGKREFGDELGAIISIPIMVIEEDVRKKIIGTLSVTSPRPIRMKLSPTSRQSRILMAVNETTQEIKFKPLRPADPEPAIILDRKNLIEEGRELLSQTGHSLQNTLRQTTTVPLHGMKPLSATHKITDSRAAHEIGLQKLHQAPSNFRLEVLTNNRAGFRSPYELQRFQRMRKKRLRPSNVNDF